jgi:hypothetical protein
MCATICAGASAATVSPTGTASEVGSPAFVVSEDGQEVLDVKSHLIWRRCVEGMRWTGKTCWGLAAEVDHADAQEIVQRESSRSGLAWRLPFSPELMHLVDKNWRKPTVDPKVFPATPPLWHWTSSISVGTGNFNQYNYGNIVQGKTPGSINQVSFLHGWGVNFATGEARGNISRRTEMAVRLVRVAPAKAP